MHMRYKFYGLHPGENIPSCDELYDSKNAIRERLASFHSADFDDDRTEKWTLEELLDYGQWGIKEVAYKCPLCEAGDVEYRQWLSTHVYVCDECPYVAFEYSGDKEIKELTDYLNHH